MGAHSAVIDAPVRAVRPAELALTGLTARRARRNRDFRAELRDAFLRTTGKHRMTFIPLDKYSIGVD